MFASISLNAAQRQPYSSGRRLLHATLLAALATFTVASPSNAADAVNGVRLYALDCGRIDFENMGMFSDTGEYDGRRGAMTVPCLLVRHPEGALLWDAGIAHDVAHRGGDAGGDNVRVSVPETLATQLNAHGIQLSASTSLTEQLNELGLSTADIRYLAFSHLHFDHTGNANRFQHATWIINRDELAWATKTPTPFGVDPRSFSAHESVDKRMIDGARDVFGDGTVRILDAPGHTPGMQVLRLELADAGVVILSGDLYHLRPSREHRRVPNGNHDRAATLASMDRVETIVDNTNARLVIQHDPDSVDALPEFPGYLH